MISTHVLDTSRGLPASNISVSLEKRDGEIWAKIAAGKTNSDGRIAFGVESEKGLYRLTFQTSAYFQLNQTESFFSEIPVLFSISDASRKYHVPLLLNPFGYSTYRGS